MVGNNRHVCTFKVIGSQKANEAKCRVQTNTIHTQNCMFQVITIQKTNSFCHLSFCRFYHYVFLPASLNQLKPVAKAVFATLCQH